MLHQGSRMLHRKDKNARLQPAPARRFFLFGRAPGPTRAFYPAWRLRSAGAGPGSGCPLLWGRLKLYPPSGQTASAAPYRSHPSRGRPETIMSLRSRVRGAAPELEEQVDWQQPPEFLEQELPEKTERLLEQELEEFMGTTTLPQIKVSEGAKRFAERLRCDS